MQSTLSSDCRKLICVIKDAENTLEYDYVERAVMKNFLQDVRFLICGALADRLVFDMSGKLVITWLSYIVLQFCRGLLHNSVRVHWEYNTY